jgi:DNA mismatch endonuclease (patch repair protein)
MAPEPLDETIRRRMQRQGRRDTAVELAVRRRLHALGYRYRVDHRPEPGLRTRGDIVFTRQKLVVFIDGCFWHGWPLHSTAPKNNAAWWAEKIAANKSRDERAAGALREAGWTVVRAWEHEDSEDVVQRIVEMLASLG